MRSPRTVAALAFALVGLAVGVPSASAIDPFPIDGLISLSNDNFTVHYDGDDTNLTCDDFITEQDAGDIAGMLDRARKFYAGMGLSWPAPLPDTDAHVHVAVENFATGCAVYGVIPPGNDPLTRWDAVLEPIGGGADNIHLNMAKLGLTYPVIAHEVFHLIEDTLAPGADQWLGEGTAEWAAIRANQAVSGLGVNPDRTVDCVGTRCGDTEFDKNGYPGWMLFEYLAEQYGDQKVRDVWEQAKTNPSGTADLAAVLPSGTSLSSFFNDYTTKRLTGGFTLPGLKGELPTVYDDIPVDTSDSDLPAANVAVNHFAVRYLTFSHGSDPTRPCFAATLKLSVEIPPGVVSTPTYYANTNGAAAQPLAVSGTTASISVPWNTCAASPNAYLSLPNDSLGRDGLEFKVTGNVSVDMQTPASPAEPPPGVHVIGTPISVPTSDPAPALNIYAPEVLRVSSKTRLLRFVVFSSGDGKLGAVLGSTGLGSAVLRSGNNDVRFVLPTQLFKSLRTKRSANVLQLTSESPSGAKGATFTRRVVVQTPPKPKPKKKNTPKKKH
jgi:hypothetical protein